MGQISMASADWVILAVVVISALISLIRGFVKEGMSLVIWVVAFLVAVNFKGDVAAALVDFIDLPSVRELTAMVGLFVVTLMLGGMVNYLLGKLIITTGLSGTDRLLGLLFGVFRGLLIVLALVIFTPQVLPVDQDPWWHQSTFIPHFQQFEQWGRETFHATKDYIASWM